MFAIFLGLAIGSTVFAQEYSDSEWLRLTVGRDVFASASSPADGICNVTHLLIKSMWKENSSKAPMVQEFRINGQSLLTKSGQTVGSIDSTNHTFRIQMPPTVMKGWAVKLFAPNLSRIISYRGNMDTSQGSRVDTILNETGEKICEFISHRKIISAIESK
jgi:hypothetical protein